MSKWLEKQRLREEEARRAQEMILEEEIVEPPAPPAGDGRMYTLLEGETIWSVARRFGYTGNELAEHNDIDKQDMFSVHEGSTLHLPKPREIFIEPRVTYEVFDEPRVMHVKGPEGTTKWSFSHVRSWNEIRPTGPVYRQNSIVTIVALAKVPVEGQVAAYYMDKVSLGKYVQTGRPAYTTGFKWRDLKAGLPDVSVPPSEKPVQDPPKEEPKPAEPNKYKTSYIAFEDGAIRHVFTRRVVISDLDGRRLPKERYAGDTVDIAGTFKKEGRLYGRPYGCIASGLWYGVPMDAIVEQEYDDDIYATTEQVPAKRLAFRDGRLTLEERMIVVPIRRFEKRSQGLINLITKIKKG